MLVRALFKRAARPAACPLGATYRLDRIDIDHVRRYSDAFGFAADTVPLTYCYLLAQRAQLATMLGRAIPFRIPGLIHVANELALHRPVQVDVPLTLATTLSMPPPDANGALECVLSTQALQCEQMTFTCISRYLIKRGQRSKPRASPSIPPPLARCAEWFVAPDAGRRYAALSGDWNPIHLWPWSARLVGMRQPIIHGMHTVAMACALSRPATAGIATSINCRFRAPVALGSTVFLTEGPDPRAFAVVSGQRVVVDGAITWTADTSAVVVAPHQQTSCPHAPPDL